MAHKYKKFNKCLLNLNTMLCFYKSESKEFGGAGYATKRRKNFSGSHSIIKSPHQSMV